MSASKVCSVVGCSKATKTRRNMCGMHVSRVFKYGTTELPARDPLKRADAHFWAKVQGGDVDSCWLWTAEVKDNGYGSFSTKLLDGFGRATYAHRYSYTRLRGDIPEGLHLDHLCHSRDASCPGANDCLHRRCVNPWHLEPVTPKVNSGRVVSLITHCPQGHPYDEANTYLASDHGRQCRICRREATRQYKARLVALFALDPTAAPHGTLNAYNGWGCRCQACRDASTARRRDWRVRRNA